VAFPQGKPAPHTHSQYQQQPGRKHEDAKRKGRRDDQLLQNATHRLDHAESISGLSPGPFQPVMKRGILIGSEIQARGMLHATGTDVERKPVGKEDVNVVNR
jgi:hypothetical protein